MTERVQRTHPTQRMFTYTHCKIEDSTKWELCINMSFFSNSIILFVFRLLLLAFSFVDYSENRLASWAQTANKPQDWTESLINNLLPIRQDFLSGFILLSCVEHAFVSPCLYVCGFVCVQPTLARFGPRRENNFHTTICCVLANHIAYIDLWKPQHKTLCKG